MQKVVAGMTMSVDGYVNDRNGDTSRLYPNLEKIRELPIVKAAIETTGAVLMGRRSYEMANGDLTGYEFQTRRSPSRMSRPPRSTATPRRSRRRRGEGIEMAVARARDAAGPKNVQVVGGVDVIQQLLQQGLVDELVIGIAPVLLGGGLRLFDRAEDAGIVLEQLEVIAAPGRTDVRFRVIGGGRL